MATLAYVAFIRCTRAQLQLLTKDVTHLKCSAAVNKIKHHYFYQQPLCRNFSKRYSESGVNENVQRKDTDTVKSKDLHSKDQPVTDDNNASSIDTEVLYASNELHHFHSQGKDGRTKIPKRSSGLSIHSRSNKTRTVSQHFEQSFINYYNTVTVKEIDSGTHSHLQTRPLWKEGAGKNKNKQESTFGALTMEVSNEGSKPDWRNPNERIDELVPEDTDERRDPRLDIPLTTYGMKNRRSFYYSKIISMFGREGKIKEAIAVFESWMMVRDRVMPTKRAFVTLIGILGRVGYAKKAFELFGKMKQLGLDPEDHIYTSLFNACANSPTSAEGLKRAEYLLNHMKEKGVLPNLFTVKAAMKALAVCGDFPRVFALLDETSSRLRLDVECFNHLLIACISDKEAGFMRALQVWQKMSQYRQRPEVSTFNLLIRCARDCGIGNIKTFASSVGLESADVEIGQFPNLLESVNHSLDKKHGEVKNLSLRRPALLTDATRQSENKLKVIGTKMNIHSPASSEQQDSDTYTDDEPRRLTVLRDNISLNPCEIRNFSESSITNTVEDVYDLPDKDVSESMICAANTIISSEWGEKKSFNLNNSEVNIFSAVSNETKYGDSFKSLYSDILSEDSNSIPKPNTLSKISVKDLKLPTGRLALLGGASKLVSFMEVSGAHPEVKTFAQILACIPNDEHSEFELLRLMEERNIKPDIDLLNDIMMRRFARRDDAAAVKAVLKIIAKLRLTPNMRTYAALSLTCRKEKDAHELLQDMQDSNLEPNSVIMQHLIFISRTNFTYKLKMLKTLESLGMKATQNIIETIEKSIVFTKEKIIEAEKKKDTSSYYLSEHFQRSFQYFMRYYKTWLMRTEVEKPRHPWDAFKASPDPKQEKLATVS